MHLPYDYLLVCLAQKNTLRLDDFGNNYEVMREAPVWVFANELSVGTRIITGSTATHLDMIIINVIDVDLSNSGRVFLLKQDHPSQKFQMAYEFADPSISKDTAVYSFKNQGGDIEYFVANSMDIYINPSLSELNRFKLDLNGEKNWIANYETAD